MSIDVLLKPSHLPFEAPDFKAFKDDDFLPAIKEGIERARKNIEKIKNNSEEPTFENTILALEEADDDLSRASNLFYNLLYSHTNDKLQALSQEIGPLSAAFSNDVLLDPDLFKRVDALYQKKDSLGLSGEQKMLLDNSWKSFTRNGANLNEEDKKTLREIDAEMSVLGPQFAENVLKSSNAYELIIEDEADLAGLPKNAIEAAAESAEEKGHKGKWRFSLDMPSYIAFSTYADNRGLREQVWRAFSRRAFEDKFDNQELILKIVSLRDKRAKLLGYKNHAEFVMERRMAKTPERVEEFIKNIIDKALPKAKEEVEELKAFAKETDGIETLKPWDVSYYAEKLKKKKFDFDEEELRPYYQLDNVIDGMLLHAEKLYNLRFEKAEAGKYAIYHDDVQVYEIYDKKTGDFQALYYLDLFPRESKKGGAWMNTFREQGLEDGQMKRPHVVNVCNFTKPTKSTPSLLTHREVETLFHEFGHGLHSILSDVTYKSVSGPNVLWDFVELPSQINENWTLEEETLSTFAKHYETGHPIPQELIAKLKKSKQFMSGSFTIRQKTFSTLDMALHTADPSTIKDVLSFEREAIKDLVLLPYEDGCTSTAFAHIFAGGYSAGYYSYMWAEVLDADAFEAFKQNGLYDPETAQKFRTLMARGGSEDPMVLFVDFRGREPSEEALMKRKGLI